MNLKQLREKGGFVPLTPVAKELTWTPPGSDDSFQFTVHIRKLSFGAVEKLWGGLDKDADKSRIASFLSSTILLGEDGKEALTYQDAYQLEPSLATVFIEAVNAVNGIGASEKNSQPPMNSGAS